MWSTCGGVRRRDQTLPQAASKFVISVCILLLMSLISQWRWPCHSKKEKNKTSTLEATHVGPFTPHFSFPKYPPPSPPPLNIPFCLYISFPPSSAFSSSPPHWLDHKVSVADDSELWKEQGDAGAERLSGGIEAPHLFLRVAGVSSHFLEACPNLSPYLTYVLLLTQQQIDPQLDPGFQEASPPSFWPIAFAKMWAT